MERQRKVRWSELRKINKIYTPLNEQRLRARVSAQSRDCQLNNGERPREEIALSRSESRSGKVPEIAESARAVQARDEGREAQAQAGRNRVILAPPRRRT